MPQTPASLGVTLSLLYKVWCQIIYLTVMVVLIIVGWIVPMQLLNVALSPIDFLIIVFIRQAAVQDTPIIERNTDLRATSLAKTAYIVYGPLSITRA